MRPPAALRVMHMLHILLNEGGQDLWMRCGFMQHMTPHSEDTSNSLYDLACMYLYLLLVRRSRRG